MLKLDKEPIYISNQDDLDEYLDDLILEDEYDYNTIIDHPERIEERDLPKLYLIPKHNKNTWYLSWSTRLGTRFIILL